MKALLYLIGLAVVLSLGAASFASAPVASHSRGDQSSPTGAVSPSPEVSPSPDDTPETEASPSPDASPSAHPCNHGFYVSQAAHSHKGGAFTSQIARSDLGKNGDCSQPLPSPSG